MTGSVRKGGGIVEEKICENEGHGFAGRENSVDSIMRTARFLEAHVGEKKRA
jgi:dipeptidyl aminopeptidase/acylaminoacyl peptidase